MLKVENLRVKRGKKEIIKGVSLTIRPGELHVLMGPNGSGKSTLSLALMGYPSCEIIAGTVLLDKVKINRLSATERARKGIFLAFQYPVEVPGVTMRGFLRTAYKELNNNVEDFDEKLKNALNSLRIDRSFMERSLNEGFSGGEKKKSEILQLALFEPKYAILDETDSGLDISSLKVVAEGINKCREENEDMGILLITHYPRILKHLSVDFVHIMVDGNIVKVGDRSLAREVEKNGYEIYGK